MKSGPWAWLIAGLASEILKPYRAQAWLGLGPGLLVTNVYNLLFNSSSILMSLLSDYKALVTEILTVILAGSMCKELQSFNNIREVYMWGATTQLISFAVLHLTVFLVLQKPGPKPRAWAFRIKSLSLSPLQARCWGLAL
ncbi:hypothetical protein EV421DRAFT_1858422 [Armillaria borealis]|uniref:Uncharacterized protein n=1 Tax=Armillaria borealis TaxID=47425 RepID=A0AA39ME76_9AGAR|nr:hypothetical protein EV421DRAFT_1858422 [Armillaria borealis]